jgi:small GTP-binding protein
MELGNKIQIYKIIVIGNVNCGKSSLINVFINKEFRSTYDPTIGIDFNVVTVTLQKEIIRLQLWDTAGHERFRSITRSYYKGTHGAIICYDATCMASYNNINMWMKDLDVICPNIPIILVGNKIDLMKKVSTEKAETFAKENNLLFIETSAKKNINITECFELLYKEVHNKNKLTNIDFKSNIIDLKDTKKKCRI